MIAGNLSHLFESAILDIIDPGGEVFDDIARHLLQLLPRPLAQLHPINHIVLIIHLSGEYIYQELRAHSGNGGSRKRWKRPKSRQRREDSSDTPIGAVSAGVAKGNVADDEAVHHKSREIKDYFLDRHEYWDVAAGHQSHFSVGMIPYALKIQTL